MHGKRPTITSLHGIVAAAHPLAAQAGARMLASGGNAFDAAAATAAALNVVEPFMSGLAGLGLATCYVAKEQRVRTLDFVPRVPASLPVERFSTARGSSARALVGCGARQFCRLGRACPRLRQETAQGCTPAGDCARARRFRACRVRRRRDQRTITPAQGLSRVLRRLGEDLCRQAGFARTDHPATGSRTNAGGACQRGARPSLRRCARQDDRCTSARARRIADAGRSRGGQARMEGAADGDVSRPCDQHGAAAMRGIPVSADPAHPRTVRSRAA